MVKCPSEDFARSVSRLSTTYKVATRLKHPRSRIYN